MKKLILSIFIFTHSISFIQGQTEVLPDTTKTDSVVYESEEVDADDATENYNEEENYTGHSAGFSIDSISEKYRPENTGKKAFDESDYAKAIRGLNYDKEKKQEVKKKTPAPELKLNTKTSFLGVGQVILIVIILLVLCFLIYFIIKNAGKNNPNIKEDPEWLQVDIEKEASPEQILQRKLDECLAAGNYAFAVRLLYLQTLADLHRIQLIRWKKDKTNADYVGELRSTSFHRRFRDLTRWFEKSWYSSTPPNEAAYRRLEPLFHAFRSSIAEYKSNTKA